MPEPLTWTDDQVGNITNVQAEICQMTVVVNGRFSYTRTEGPVCRKIAILLENPDNVAASEAKQPPTRSEVGIARTQGPLSLCSSKLQE